MSATDRAGRNRTRRPGGPRWSSRSARFDRPNLSMSSRSGSTGTVRRSPQSTTRGEATRPAITFLDTRATAEADELAAATGIRGWALGPLPAALWLERHEPDVAARTRWYLTTWEWLAFRLTGAAAAPIVPGQAIPDPTVVAEATGLHVDRRPPVVAMGSHRRRPERASPPRRSISAPASRSPAGPTTPSRAISVRASPRPATPTTRAVRRAGSACTGTSRSRFPARS